MANNSYVLVIDNVNCFIGYACTASNARGAVSPQGDNRHVSHTLTDLACLVDLEANKFPTASARKGHIGISNHCRGITRL